MRTMRTKTAVTVSKDFIIYDKTLVSTTIEGSEKTLTRTLGRYEKHNKKS